MDQADSVISSGYSAQLTFMLSMDFPSGFEITLPMQLLLGAVRVDARDRYLILLMASEFYFEYLPEVGLLFIT